MIFRRSCVISFIACVCLAALSCASTGKAQNVQQSDLQNSTDQNDSKITLVFAGDIMAHKINYTAGNFDEIWRDIKPIVKNSDLAFANLEAPVNDRMEWSTYPQFNMHSAYVNAAIDAGFNVFSLANNHTNDWYLDGIKATGHFFNSNKNVWACGIKEKSGSPLTYRLIQKNDWKILFVAVTEILNRPDFASYIDYYPAKKHGKLIEELKALAQNTPHDLFVLSVHTDDEEYKTKVTESRKKFFKTLASECGIDIIWANHPHVSMEFEKIELEDGLRTFIMYANGNTISGQRTNPSFYKKPNERDLTGDGLLFKIVCSKSRKFDSIDSYFITTLIKSNGQFVIRLVDDDLIHSLDRSGVDHWKNYLVERRKIYDSLKEKSKWQ